MKVLALLLVALAVANASFLQEVEQEVSSAFDDLKGGARNFLANTKDMFADGVDDVDDALEEMKSGLLMMVKKCANDDHCRQIVHSVMDDLLNDVAASKEKREAITAAAIAAANACLANPTCSGVAKSAASALLNGFKGLWDKLFGKREVITATAIAAANACLSNPTCSFVAKSAATELLKKAGDLGEKVVDGVKHLWHKIFGKRVAITATAIAAANACLANPICSTAAKAAASALLSNAGNIVDGVKDLWHKIFGKREVITATAIAAANACLSNPTCSFVAKSAATELLKKAGDLGEKVVDGVKHLWHKIFGKRVAITATAIAAANACLANPICSTAAKAAASALLSNAGNIVDGVKDLWHKIFGKRVAITATAIAAANACLANPICSTAAKAAATALIQNAGGARNFPANTKDMFADGVDDVDDALEEMKSGLLMMVKKCANDDHCHQIVHSVMDDLLNDVAASKEKRKAVTAAAIAAANACLANPTCSGVAKSAATALLNGFKGLWEKLFGKREAITANTIAAAKACLSNPTCSSSSKSAAAVLLKDIKFLWNKIFGKRVAITATAIAAANACLANPICSTAAKAAATALLKIAESTYEDSTYEDSAYEDFTYKDSTYEDSTYEDSTYEDSTYEDFTYKDCTYEDSTYEDSTYEDSTYEDSTYEDSTYEDSTYENLT
ncbi:uncharacterized protein [Watersipora subatra]|uniref:uncharacterized protein n=1 Tax=Watersipora subatra TaxID=2589382 RepID=UPI00355B0239